MLVTFKLSEPLLKAEEKARRSWEREYGNIFDKLYNVYLVKNFTMEEAEKKRFEKALFGKAFPKYEEAIKRFARLQHAQGIIYTVSFVIALGAAILFLRNGQITQGEFIMFFGYVNQFYGPFFSLSKFYTDSKKVSVAVKRIVSLERIAPETIEHGNKTIKDFKGHILFKNLSFRYTKKKEVLHDINLEIKPGECVALVGESGVGKTTLAELILGYWKPTKGNIYLDGVEISELSLKWLREKIAFVPQEISLFNDTLINNIRYANPSATFDDVVKAAKAANAHDFIMSLPKGYNTLVGERGVKLSVGQKQRISLTMAFLKNPKILILDEPTSAQDVKSERAIQEGIKRLISGRTTIIIAHRFSTIRNADKIVVLDKGRIVEVGSHDELMKKKGKYYGFYTLQRGLD
jgi:ABC-type multidrug transport system fused ATPase/permease subunit